MSAFCSTSLFWGPLYDICWVYQMYDHVMQNIYIMIVIMYLVLCNYFHSYCEWIQIKYAYDGQYIMYCSC